MSVTVWKASGARLTYSIALLLGSTSASSTGIIFGAGAAGMGLGLNLNMVDDVVSDCKVVASRLEFI